VILCMFLEELVHRKFGETVTPCGMLGCDRVTLLKVLCHREPGNNVR